MAKDFQKAVVCIGTKIAGSFWVQLTALCLFLIVGVGTMETWLPWMMYAILLGILVHGIVDHVRERRKKEPS
jgi:hypothetical protein